MLSGALEAGYTHVRFVHVAKLLLQPFCVGGALTGVALVVGLRSVVAVPVWEGRILRSAVASHTLVGSDLWGDLSGDDVQQLSNGKEMTWTRMWGRIFGDETVQRKMNLWLAEDGGLCALVHQAVNNACADPLLALTLGAMTVRTGLLRCVVVDTREVPQTSRIAAQLRNQLGSSLGVKVVVADSFLPLRAGVQLASLGSMADIPFVSPHARAQATACSRAALELHANTIQGSLCGKFVHRPDGSGGPTVNMVAALHTGLDETMLQLQHRFRFRLRRAKQLRPNTPKRMVSNVDKESTPRSRSRSRTGSLQTSRVPEESSLKSSSNSGGVNTWFSGVGKKLKGIFRKNNTH